jgi:hypothetical protein
MMNRLRGAMEQLHAAVSGDHQTTLDVANALHFWGQTEPERRRALGTFKAAKARILAALQAIEDELAKSHEEAKAAAKPNGSG